jgi:hypothetical protein
MKNCKHCNSTKFTLNGIVMASLKLNIVIDVKIVTKLLEEGDKRIVHSLKKENKKLLNLIFKELVLDQLLG